MRKLLIGALATFAIAFTVGFTASPAQAKGGGSANCYYTCNCAGIPLYCCVFNGNVQCKIAFNAPFGCTQQYDC